MRRRQHRAEDAPQPRPRTGSAPPIRREIDPVLGQRRSQRRCRALVAAEPVASQAGRAAVHTVDASWRRPAPSQTQPPPPERHCDRRPTRPDTPAARSSRCRAPPAELTTDSRPGGCRRSSHPEGRTRRLARAGLAAYSVREAGFPSTSSPEAKSQNGDSLVQRSGSLSLAAAPPPLHGSELTRACARRANSSRARTSTRVTLLGLRRHAAAAAVRALCDAWDGQLQPSKYARVALPGVEETFQVQGLNVVCADRSNCFLHRSPGHHSSLGPRVAFHN